MAVSVYLYFKIIVITLRASGDNMYVSPFPGSEFRWTREL